MYRGSKHDSTAFKRSKLYKFLTDNTVRMMKHGFYILGDSDYALRPWLLTPYDNAWHGTGKDSFNFHHSSNCIFAECAFGEIDARWGILWGPLRFLLHNNIHIIDATMRLYNHIVKYDLLHKKGVHYVQNSMWTY